MTAPTRPQIAALRGLLTGAGLAVQDGGTGDPVAPCVVLWPTPGRVHAGSLGDPTSYLAIDVTTVCCGETTDQAMWVADKVTATLTRATPAVTGRTPQPIECLSETPVQRDDDLAYPLFYAALRWRFLTTP